MVEESIPDWIEYFLNEFFPNMSKNEEKYICQILCWPNEKKTAFLLALKIYEEESTES